MENMTQQERIHFFNEYENLLKQKEGLQKEKEIRLKKLSEERQKEIDGIPKVTPPPRPRSTNTKKDPKPKNGRLIILRNLIIIWILLMFIRTEHHVYSNLFMAFILSFIVTFTKFPILYLLSPITARIKTKPIKEKNTNKPIEPSTNYQTEMNKINAKYRLLSQQEISDIEHNINLINLDLKPYQQKLPLHTTKELHGDAFYLSSISSQES